MTVELPPHKSEATGNAALDRIQNNVRTLFAYLKQLAADSRLLAAYARLTVLENRSYIALATDVSINVAAYADLLTTTITTTLAAGYLIVRWSVAAGNASACSLFYQVLVDGVVIKGVRADVAAGGGTGSSMVVRVAAKAGKHTVALQWKTNVNGAHVKALTVVEEHAHLLVQEAA